MNLRSDLFDEVLDRAVAHVDNFIVSISNLLVELDQFEGLTLHRFLASDGVYEYIWDSAIFIVELCDGYAYVVLSGRLEFQVERKFMLT